MLKKLIAPALLIAATSTFSLASCSSIPGTRAGDLRLVEARHAPLPEITGSLRVMSFNLAHGRRESFHQMLLSKSAIKSNLAKVGAMIEREQPDVVALQEADGPSFWSGAFHHVDTVAKNASYPIAVHGAHVEGVGLRYGTGLLSRAHVVDPVSLTFAPSPPTPAKGMTVASVKLDGVLVDVVSVHLDFAQGDARRAQVAEMISLLKGRERPVIVMGDFNSDWDDDDSAVRAACDGLGLAAFEPEASCDVPGVETFPTFNKRLDWILVSKELEVVKHRVLDDALSDHRPVWAEVRLKQAGAVASR